MHRLHSGVLGLPVRTRATASSGGEKVKLRSPAVLLAAVAVAGGGCGTDDEAGRTGAGTTDRTTEATVVARGKLRTAVAPAQARGEAVPMVTFTGVEAVTVELARAADGSFTLIVGGEWEPGRIVIATGTCEGYAERQEPGEELYRVSDLPGDQSQGGDVAERHELPLAKETAAKLLAAVPVAVFGGDSRGAHAGEYIFCGTLEATESP